MIRDFFKPYRLAALVAAFAFGSLAQAQSEIPDSIQLSDEIPAYTRLSTPYVSARQEVPARQVVPVQYSVPAQPVADSVVTNPVQSAQVTQPAIPSNAPTQGVPVYTPDSSVPEAAPIVEEAVVEEPGDGLLQEYIAPYTEPTSMGMMGTGSLFVEGWIDQGFNVNSNKSKENLPMATNDQEGYQLNQVYLSFGRHVFKADQWSIGGQIDVMFGTDYYYMTSTGLETTTSNAPRINGTDENGSYRMSRAMYGMALPQAFAEVYAPILAGVDVKVGHFNSVMGFESNQATQNFFYSRSYQSIYGMPTSMTGVMTDWNVTENWSVIAGAVNEWNAFCTPENHFSLVVGATFENYRKNFAVSAIVMNGKQSAATFQADDYSDEASNTTVFNLIAKYKFTERMAYVAEFTYGNDDSSVYDMRRGENFQGRNWYGFSNYLFFCASDHLTLGARFEWFHDKENTLISGGNKSTFANMPANYFSWSFGANWDPFKWLTVRPEVRWDYSDMELDVAGQKYYAFDRNSANYQFTVGCDAIVKF